MATHKSAEKRIRQSLKRTVRNRQTRSKIRTLIKNIRASVHDKDKEKALQNYLLVQKTLDKAAAKHLFHKKNVSNKKSRLTRLINSI